MPQYTGDFLDMYATGQPVISSYIASDSNRRIVFALPMDVPYTINGVTYSGLAVSYNNDVVEKLIAGNIYQGQSELLTSLHLMAMSSFPLNPNRISPAHI